MKKLHFIAALAISALFAIACGNNKAGTETTADSSATVIPPPDNSSATNPSLADTNYSKNNADTLKAKKDSLK
jgi:PBP1b-binding outer membrane lipoprotein LpoB